MYSHIYQPRPRCNTSIHYTNPTFLHGTSCREGRERRSEHIALPHAAGERRGSSPPARATQIWFEGRRRRSDWRGLPPLLPLLRRPAPQAIATSSAGSDPLGHCLLHLLRRPARPPLLLLSPVREVTSFAVFTGPCGHQPTTSAASAGPRALLLCSPRGDHLPQALFAAEENSWEKKWGRGVGRTPSALWRWRWVICWTRYSSNFSLILRVGVHMSKLLWTVLQCCQPWLMPWNWHRRASWRVPHWS
jgi:hypothetical protein